MRTLVVDDSALFREALVSLLEEETDCQIIGLAANGAEALQIARVEQPDLIVMDLNMPIMDGLEATRRIKAEMPSIRILLLTAASADQVKRLAIGHGAEDCLDKDGRAILAAVSRLTGQSTGCVASAIAAP